MMKHSGKILGIVIVAVWIVMMAVLIKKNVFTSSNFFFEEKYLVEDIESRQEWAGLYLKNHKIGYSFSEIKRMEEGYRITENMFMNMKVMGVPQKIESKINSVTDREMNLKNFSFRIKSGVVSFIAYGNLDNDVLKLMIVSGGKKINKELKLKDKPILSTGLKYFILKKGLKVGSSFRRVIFDPLTLANRAIDVEVVSKEKITIHGKEINCFKIKEVFNGIKLFTWVDEQGETLKEESPIGIVLIRETKEEALKIFDGDKVDLISETAIKVDRKIILKGLTYLKLRIKNINIKDFDLDWERQVQNGDVIEVKAEHLSRKDTYVLPFNDSGMDKYLAPTTLIQSDDEVIKKLAKSIIKEENDAKKAVNKLYLWVYENIEKKPTLSIPSALEVVKTKQGDCNEHAVLFTALCRAIQVPARICAGIVYVNEGFFYHAWSEIFLGRWIAIDPTLKQFPADVTHIKFFEGEMEDQLGVLNLVGRLEIEVLEQK
jgi:hypothetical protein